VCRSHHARARGAFLSAHGRGLPGIARHLIFLVKITAKNKGQYYFSYERAKELSADDSLPRLENMDTRTAAAILAQPSLETPRLLLRPLTLADGKEIQRLAGDIRIAKMTLSVPHPYPEGLAEEWIATHPDQFREGEGVVFGICLKAIGVLIGCISIEGISETHRRGEVGYWIGCDYWNQGYCTEALQALIEFGFRQMNLNKLTARHMAKNPQSGRVMLKAGMKQEGHFKDDCFRWGQFEDSVVYGLTRRDADQGA